MDLNLDLGFEAIATAHDNYYATDPMIRWACDWVILNYLQEVTPSCDVNMFKLYADRYSIDIDGTTNKELVELASEYSKPIALFIVDNLKSRIYSMLDFWKDSKTRKIPAKCHKTLLNLLMLINNTTGTDLNPIFTQFIAELSQATTAKNTRTFDIPDVFELVTIDQLHTYISVIKTYVDKCFAINDPAEFEFDIFQGKFKSIIRFLKSILMICMPTPHGIPFSNVREIFEQLIAPNTLYCFDTDTQAKLNSLRDLDVAHAVCINSSNIDVLELDSDSVPVTDAYRVLVSTLVCEYIHERKCCDASR